MGEHLLKNWIVYVLLAGFIWFVVYVFITSRRQESKDNKPDKKEEKGKQM